MTNRKSQIGDYSPDEESRQKALAYWRKNERQDLIADIDDQVELFVSYHAAHGSQMVLWPRAWVTWFMQAHKFTEAKAKRRVALSENRKPSAHDRFLAGGAAFLARLDASEDGIQSESEGHKH